MTTMDVPLNIQTEHSHTECPPLSGTPHKSDGALKNTVRIKIRRYRQLYVDKSDQILFPLICLRGLSFLSLTSLNLVSSTLLSFCFLHNIKLHQVLEQFVFLFILRVLLFVWVHLILLRLDDEILQEIRVLVCATLSPGSPTSRCPKLLT